MRVLGQLREVAQAGWPRTLQMMPGESPGRCSAPPSSRCAAPRGERRGGVGGGGGGGGLCCCQVVAAALGMFAVDGALRRAHPHQRYKARGPLGISGG